MSKREEKETETSVRFAVSISICHSYTMDPSQRSKSLLLLLRPVPTTLYFVLSPSTSGLGPNHSSTPALQHSSSPSTAAVAQSGSPRAAATSSILPKYFAVGPRNLAH